MDGSGVAFWGGLVAGGCCSLEGVTFVIAVIRRVVERHGPTIRGWRFIAAGAMLLGGGTV